VHIYETNGSIKRFDTLEDYFRLNKEVLLNGVNHRETVDHYRTEIMDRVWIGKNVKISPKAYLLGPVVIGDDCIIEDYAQVLGPTSIGSGSCIDKDVLVRESIVWKDVQLQRQSCVEYSLIGEACVVSEGQTVRNSAMIQVKDDRHGVYHLISSEGEHPVRAVVSEYGLSVPSLYKVFRHKAFLAAKRLMDLSVSSLALLFFLPLFGIIALAIKIDSRGPVFFCQRRCGKDGQDFYMYKFRTMVEGAEKIQGQLLEKKDGDGPMFKMKNDPRVTRVGRILRKTFLDELPQFFNVLKGEMSLVGPRPLKMEEMAFCPSWRDLRLKVKPGMTGLWQVEHGGEAADFNQWISYDLGYLGHQSFWLDVRILFKTLGVILKRVGTLWRMAC
jgi:lipopolysaccharide/colanic/teichoic acid biosynthesis glycosyltransferase/carbonic anhydrase/acetyltransferase-like protein (isoleucine patch superfamily)